MEETAGDGGLDVIIHGEEKGTIVIHQDQKH